ncbi:MAG TPA: DNA replication/repair protein RecF [Steroidobacteraceae bacterium]|nr:DNA replication/repair protein RecF [Steroidobacteraceae bacterium]
MSLALLRVENVRCLTHVELELSRERNLIYGPNGSGKTSLLEAIFLLGRGRSFRTRNTDRLIRIGQTQLTVFGRVESGLDTTIGIQATRGAPTVARIAGAPVGSLTELSEAFPVQVIDPGLHRLVEDSAQRRRRWLDWAVFHVEPGFGNVWADYSRALRQRNAALRTRPPEATAWDRELARLGEQLTAARMRTLERLRPYWTGASHALISDAVELGYTRGWPAEQSLLESLESSLARDQLRGVTHFGAHRADVQLRLRGRPARDVASRGQQKLIAAAMILAQVEMVQEVLPTPATLLLDDPAAELDRARLAAFIECVIALRCQLVVTGLTPDASAFGRAERLFHVEQGRVGPV